MLNFCPECGSEQGPFVKGFCNQCFLADRKLVEIPDVLELAHCPRCNKVKYRDKWVEQSGQGFEGIILAKAKVKDLALPKFSVELTPGDDGMTQALVTVRGTVDGTPVSVQKLVLVKPVSGICDSCMKLSSYYHEAIVQLRFPQDLTQDQAHEHLAFVKTTLKNLQDEDQLAGLIDYIWVAKGMDFLIGSKHAGKKVSEALARKLHGTLTRSFKLMGVNQSGKDKKRYTFCVRIE